MVIEKTEIDLLLSSEYSDGTSSDDTETEDVYIVAGSMTLSPHHLTIRARVAENPATPTWLLYHLSQDEDHHVREMLAENPCVTQELLRFLAKDNCDDVRFGLAENPQMPLEILETLIEDKNPYIAARAVKTLNHKLRSARLEDTGLLPNQFHVLGPRQLHVIESAS